MWITSLLFFFFLLGRKTCHTSSFLCSSSSGKSCNLIFRVLKRQKQDNNILFLCMPTDVCFNTVSYATNKLGKTCKFQHLKYIHIVEHMNLHCYRFLFYNRNESDIIEMTIKKVPNNIYHKP